MKDVWNRMYPQSFSFTVAFSLLPDAFEERHNKWLTLPLDAGYTQAAKKPKCLLSFIEQYGIY